MRAFCLAALAVALLSTSALAQGKVLTGKEALGGWRDDAPGTTRHLTVDDEPVSLSSREWAVLERLLERPGAIVSKDQIEEALYAFGSEIESNTVEVYISRLRKKIGKERISTMRGVGYSLGAR